MKKYTKLLSTRLGKVSFTLLVLTFIAWLFVNNAQNCLSRDFVMQAPPAVCWRQTNDYENTISYSQAIYLVLLTVSIICWSAAITRPLIRRSHATMTENKKTAWFLTALSIFILIFVVTIYEVWQRTTYNNNNYSLNTATDVAVRIGAPLWLAITTATTTYWAKILRSRNS